MEHIAELNACISETLAAWSIPGAAIAVVQGAETFTQGYGLRQAGRPEAVDADTIFAIGSATKPFTSALVGMLVDEDKLKWDEPVVKRLPDLELGDAWVTRHVTVRDVLCHRLGLERAQRLYYHQGYTQRDLMHRMKHLKPVADFRTGFHYANQNYGVAGLVVEALTGQTWADALAARIFQPLGMTRSVSGYDQLGSRPNVASPHAVLDETYPASVRFVGQPSAIPWFKLSHEPSGSVLTSANDLARWLRVILQGGAPLLKPATFAEMTSPQIVMQDLMDSELAPMCVLQPPTRFWTYGLGWWVMDYANDKVLMHGGQMPGFNSAVAFFPERQLGLAVVLNVHQTLAHAALFYALADILLGRPGRSWSMQFLQVAQGYMAEVKTQVDQMLAARDSSQPPTLAPAACAGTYTSDLYGDVTVTVDTAGRLALTYGQLAASLEHYKADTFIAHWALKGLQEDALVAFGADGRSLTLVNDRAEYRRAV